MRNLGDSGSPQSHDADRSFSRLASRIAERTQLVRYEVEDYETLSPCMMDILSMRTAPLPAILAGLTVHARKKKKKKKRILHQRGPWSPDRYLALNTDSFRKTTEATSARKQALLLRCISPEISAESELRYYIFSFCCPFSATEARVLA